MDKKNKLFLVLGFFFVTNALIAEFIGVKIFSLERTLGFNPVEWNIMGFKLSFELTAGVILWPVVFIMTDLINEYYGKKGVQRLSYLTVIMLIYAFAMAFVAIGTKPAEWWIHSKSGENLQDFNVAYSHVFGQGLGIIVGSLVAFLIGQVVDAFIFQKLKKRTGSNHVWLRATGSTVISQLIDSFVVLYVAFGLLANWPMRQILAIGIMNYAYKLTMSVVLLPLLYGVHAIIEKYLGKNESEKMIAEALES